MNQRTSLIIVGALVLAGCEATHQAGNPAETDAFLRNALDTYGVIEVVPNAPLAGSPATTTAGSEPLSATTTRAARRISVAEACAGKTGVQRGLRDTRTGRWLDCGSGETQQPS